ncbi:hypothetical protein JB92DRAFT_3120847 [Gautieria morchelliformis]|nr:hypothetical protein JB92DRAFT_3120847 [Gautieria morchelliformis]
MLETLFGIWISRGHVVSQMGILGRVSGYFGVVEAQGRGTLHLHMIMWLHDAPTADEMHRLLSTEAFHGQVQEYIRANIRPHLDVLSSDEDIKAIQREPDLGYMRPPHPDAVNYDAQMNNLELCIENVLVKEYPALKQSPNTNTTLAPGSPAALPAVDDPEGSRGHDNDMGDEDHETLTLEFTPSGRMTVKSQVVDYQYQGEELEDLSFLFFIVNTYEEPISEGVQCNPSSASTVEGDGHIAQTPKRGQPKNDHAEYLPGHPRSGKVCRVVRTQGHNILPNVIGQFFPQRDDVDTQALYCTSMLALLNPWRRLTELIRGDESWETAFEKFTATAPKQIHDSMAGIHYYYDCGNVADKSQLKKDQEAGGDDVGGRADDGDNNMSIMSEDAGTSDRQQKVQLTEENIEHMIAAQRPWREVEHTRRALEVAKSARIFPSNNGAWNVSEKGKVSPANGCELGQLVAWQEALVQDANHCQTSSAAIPGRVGAYDDNSDVLSNVDLNHHCHQNPSIVLMPDDGPAAEELTSVDPSSLFVEQ